MAKRVPASMRTRQSLSDVIEGRLSSPAGREELVKLATRLIIEETLEAEARDAVANGSAARLGRKHSDSHQWIDQHAHADVRNCRSRARRTAGASAAAPWTRPHKRSLPADGAG